MATEKKSNSHSASSGGLRLAPAQRGAANSRYAMLRSLLKSNLGFHGTNGRYGTHSWHPFAAKFPPQLPRLFIENMTRPGDVVLDPMMGSGTTLLEASRLDRHATGCDIDPLAHLIVKVKLSPPAQLHALQTGVTIAHATRESWCKNARTLRAQNAKRFDEATQKFVDYWFLPDTQLQLAALLEEIEKIKSAQLRDFFKLVFSSTIIAKSGGVSLARDLAHTRPHKVDKIPATAADEFEKRLRQMIFADNVDMATFPSFSLRKASAAKLPLRPSSVDLVVTSPPYANNAIDYMRAHKFSLVWLGYSIGELSTLRSRYIGHDAAGDIKAIKLPSGCARIIGILEEQDAKKAAALMRYFAEMKATIIQMRRVLKDGCVAVIVVGSSILRGIDVKTHECLAELGEAAGFELVGIGKRQLDRDRRMMPARWNKSAKTQIEARMHEEFVIGLVKR